MVPLFTLHKSNLFYFALEAAAASIAPQWPVSAHEIPDFDSGISLTNLNGNECMSVLVREYVHHNFDAPLYKGL